MKFFSAATGSIRTLFMEGKYFPWNFFLWFFLVFGLWSLVSDSPASASLYNDIKRQVEVENAQTVDGPVATFVARFLATSTDYTTADAVNTDIKDVEAAARNDIATLCEEKPGRREALSHESCPRLLKDIRSLLTEEMRVRRLGRELVSQVTGSELSVSDVYGHPVALPLDQAAVLNLWLTGTGGIRLGTGSVLLRTQVFDENIARPIFQQLTSALSLPEDEFVGAVRRYRHGLRLIAGSRAPRFPAPPPETGSGPGTERQYETKRWSAIEAALNALWDQIPKDPNAYTPRLGIDDVVLFRFPSTLRADLPDNILVWAQVDGDPQGGHPWGDVGLAWQTQTLTANPSLLPDPPNASQPVILGGLYPPEPRDGDLCGHPLAERGYLCRSAAGNDALCGVPANVDPDKITLTNCRLASTGATLAGPDVCRELPWRMGDFDPQTQCKINLRCGTGSPCAGQLGSALTSPKDGNGVIDICINNVVEGPVTYLAYHELVHAHQICTKPVGYNPFQSLPTADAKARACCQIEGEAYHAEAMIYEEDDAFRDANGQPAVGLRTGIPINVETFTEAWTSFACGPQQGHKSCQKSRVYPKEFSLDLVDWMMHISSRNPGRVPVTCLEWKAKGDRRTNLQIRTIERRRLVCDPKMQTEYLNRIGNNMCFVGQCAEEIIELQELGGRTPMTVSDDGSAWFPVAPKERGGVVATVPAVATQTTIPSYTPALLLQEFDTALCKLVGLPPRTPPVQCLIGVQRRLDLPLLDYGTTLTKFIQQLQPQAELRFGIDELAPAYGRQLGGLLLRFYLKTALPPLADAFGVIADLLEKIRDISFPAQMCPFNGRSFTPAT